MYATGIADLTPGRPARLLDVVVGSHSAWRIAMPLAAALQNSHQDGGCVFLILVADPRTARLCNIDRFGSTGPRLGDRVRGEAAEGRCPAGLAVAGGTSSRNALTIGTSTAVSPEMPMCDAAGRIIKRAAGTFCSIPDAGVGTVRPTLRNVE